MHVLELKCMQGPLVPAVQSWHMTLVVVVVIVVIVVKVWLVSVAVVTVNVVVGSVHR